MITLLTKIKLYSAEKGRKTAFESGYRPLFNFADAHTKISGKIDLIEISQFEPGMSEIVKITFHEGIISGNYFKVGERFTFDEGQNLLGEGEIIEVAKQEGF